MSKVHVNETLFFIQIIVHGQLIRTRHTFRPSNKKKITKILPPNAIGTFFFIIPSVKQQQQQHSIGDRVRKEILQLN